jgi:hypothetical protein
MVTKRTALLTAGAACAACCAPLVAPLLPPLLVWSGLAGAGAAGSGLLAGFRWDIAACLAVIAAAAAGGLIWYRRRRHPPAVAEGQACDLDSCGPDKNPV